MSLVEVLVAMSITMLVLIMLGQVVLSSSRSARFTMTKSTTAADARTSIERMAKLLRVATKNYPGKEDDTSRIAFEAASYDSVTFYTAIGADGTEDPIPTKVRFYRDPTTKCLTEATTLGRKLSPVPASGSPFAWDAAARTRCLVKTATAPSSSKPLFLYYGSATLNTNGTSPTPLPVTAGVMTRADLDSIKSVEILLSALDPSNVGAEPVQYIDKVALDNLLVTGGGS